jgi:SAM-dependent methyltransferase
MALNAIKKVPIDFQSFADFGCGEGSFLEEIQTLYPNVDLYGLDFSKESVELCKKRIPNGTFAEHDITKAENPFKKIVDVAISSEVIEHVQEHEAAVKNMSEWCRYLIITVPGGELDEMAKDMGHLRHYTLRSLTKLANDSGLEIVYKRSWGFPMAWPLYSRLRNQAGYGAVTGKYSKKKIMLCRLLYTSFFLNDMFNLGNKHFILLHNPNLKG